MKRLLLLGLLGIFLISGLGFGAWILSLPETRAAAPPAAIGEDEVAATLAALKPTKPGRPLIAIIGANGETLTETTDYVMPYGILKRADVADVMALSTRPGAVQLFPALRVEPDATIAQFDAQHPAGADYVIVPAMSRDDDPAVLEWLRSQSAKGARIIGVCVGVKVVAAAGLLDDRRATTHWYALRELRAEHPKVRYVRDRRFVVDGNVATTTGITASTPMMLTLIEAIGGRAKAEAVAHDLGVETWDARHASDAFRFSRAFALDVFGNTLAFSWRRDHLGLRLEPGMDEVSLALVADAWSRTYRSSAVTFSDTPTVVRTRSGMRISPDQVAAQWPARSSVPALAPRPAMALDQTLAAIGARYGSGTADLVAMQLEYPGRPSGPARVAAN
jgi:putative intracellular protease/amidase